MSNLRLIIFSDLHYTDEEQNWETKRKLVEQAEPILEKLIEKINNTKELDAVINLGDFIQATKYKERDLSNIKKIWNKCQRIKYPFYTILGNHELKLVDSNKEVLKIFGYEETTYSINIKDYHLLFLGTNVNKENEKFKTQYISKKDLEFIKEDLKINSNKKIIVFSHFGIIEDKDLMSNYWAYTEYGENLMLQNRKDLLEILNKYKILGIFCGHQHWTKTLNNNSINCYMLGSLVENINNDNIPDGVYFDVLVDKNNLEVEEKHIRII